MGYYNPTIEFSSFLGLTFTGIHINEDQDEIQFTTDTGRTFVMKHDQDCCESVTLHDIVGEISDLLNVPILLAQESTSHDNPKNKYHESLTWTFYKLATIKGYVYLCWYGVSNGYYSEKVYVREVTKD